jgi:phosphatidylglycerol:prolipoprotein diacylglycerol transferase
MYPTISLGSIVLPTAGLVYIVGIWLALSTVERSAKKMGLKADALYAMAASAVAAGFIGARLLFVALHWPAYQDNLVGIVWPITSGFNLWGGLFFAFTAAFLYGRAKQLPLGASLDALAPGLLVGFMVISLADFLSGPGYGTETGFLLGINVFGIKRHAVQIYEILVAFVALIVWWVASDRRQFDGQLFLMTTAIYAAGRLLFDAYRANSPLTSNGYHIIQIVSLVILLACVYLLGRLTPKRDDEQPAQQQV